MNEYASGPIVNTNWSYNAAANPQVDVFQVGFFEAPEATLPVHVTEASGIMSRSISYGRMSDGVKYVKVRAGVKSANVWSDWSEVVKVIVSSSPAPVPKPDPPTDVWISQ
jgi:hypothetical protein